MPPGPKPQEYNPRPCDIYTPLPLNYTEGEDQIMLYLLVRLCDLVAPLVLILRKSMKKANFSGFIRKTYFRFSQ